MLLLHASQWGDIVDNTKKMSTIFILGVKHDQTEAAEGVIKAGSKTADPSAGQKVSNRITELLYYASYVPGWITGKRSVQP